MSQVDRKSAILSAALAVFSEKGIEAASIDDIRQRCQASVGSIYHHFGNKEGIAAALFEQGLDDYWARIKANLAQAGNAEFAVHSIVSTHLHWIVEQPDMARFLFARRQAVSAEHNDAIRQRTGAHFKDVFEKLKPWFKQGVLRRMPTELYGPLLLGPSQELARNWLSGRLSFDPLSVIDELSSAAWRTLATNPNHTGVQHAGAKE
ncbi:TetR/AcrR family transcriptional regulator [Pseudoduganella violaceinigra]|uniref:TetR/AcrR family transcriptional regulator n=1 Tax=Pseudoduganella violaceinigra TaxID=246602 RepID=UPI000404756A|nr:TetR/AcrR family transcriptional regulator [Pseudoduganella violaceinigra]